MSVNLSSIKPFLKRSAFVVGVAQTFRGAIVDVRKIFGSLTRTQRIGAYLQGNGLKKLHLGASNSVLRGWLNTDLFPTREGVIYLDVTRRFPFDNNTFDYVFSEHLIEHIDYDDANAMLHECYRVLKPGGRVRIATPDLEVLIGLHSDKKTNAQEHYIDWVIQRCMPDVLACKETFVINNAFRAWGHRFIHDRQTLATVMRAAGFDGIAFYEPGVSSDPNLTQLESHGNEIQAEDINKFETFIAEGLVQK